MVYRINLFKKLFEKFSFKNRQTITRKAVNFLFAKQFKDEIEPKVFDDSSICVTSTPDALDI